jgi:biopolymer transport protein ExbD
MVDVVFLLLLYFMLVSHVQNLHGIRLDAAAMVHRHAAESAILLAIRADGAVTEDGLALEAAELQRRLRSAVQEDPRLRVAVHPAPAVPLQRLVQVLDLVRASGIGHLSLVQE